MAGDIGHHLRLVVDLVPNDGVRLPCGAGSAHGEDEAPCPRHLQQLQHLETITMEIIKTLRFKLNSLWFAHREKRKPEHCTKINMKQKC